MSLSDRTTSSPGEMSNAPVSIGAFDTFCWSGAVESPRTPTEIGHLEGWTLIRQIGSGGMGVVFESLDPVSGARVAIKLLRPDLANDPHAVRRFLVEARHMREMSHPHILPVTEVLERPGGPCYVSPFLAGGALSARLRPGAPLNAEETLRIARQIASALVYAHEKGIIHRDLKPANVLLDQEDIAHLCDFGLVRTVFNDSVPELSRTHREGTAPYMSPAVAAGQAEDTRCDIYSFGAMLYEMLAGGPPYEGNNSEEIIAKVLAGPPPGILRRNPRAPAGLVMVTEECMARPLRDRYAQMADVLADLDRIAAGKNPLGPHGVAGGTRWGRIVAAIALSLLAIVGMPALWRDYFADSATAHGMTPAVALSHSGPQDVPKLAPTTTHSVATRPSAPAAIPLSPMALRIQWLVHNGTEVVLDGSSVTDADLTPLDDAKKVTVVSLMNSRVTDAGLGHLKNLTSLRELRLVQTGITGSGFGQLAGLRNLRHLHVSLSPIEDASLVHLKKLPNLLYLHSTGTRITDAGLRTLGEMTQLRQLDLSGPMITDAGLESLQNLRDMEILGLRGCHVTDQGMHFLMKMRPLTWLDLQGTQVHGRGLADLLDHLPRLQTLLLGSTPLDEAAAANMGASQKLRTLTLQNTPFNDTDLQSLMRLVNLESLCLGGTKVSDDGLAVLSEFSRLTTLDLSDLNITDAGLQNLTTLNSLRQVNLLGTHVSPAGVSTLQRALPAVMIKR